MSKIRRQLVAVIDERTTMVCLDAAGQVVDLHEPFHTLLGDQWEPPFHVHCRSMVTPYVPGLGSDLPRQARIEQARRPKSQYVHLPPKARRGLVARLRDRLRTITWTDRGSMTLGAEVGEAAPAAVRTAARVDELDRARMEAAVASNVSKGADGRRLASWRRDDMDVALFNDQAGVERWAADLGEDYLDAVRRGLPDDVTAELYGPARPSITGKVSVEIRLKQDGMDVGRILRGVDVRTGTVEHDLFKLRRSVRGRGIGKAVTEQTMELYRNVGMEAVKTHANIDVGGYAWARLGFTWDRELMDRGSVMKIIRDVAGRADQVPGMTAEWREETIAAADRMLMNIDERWPEPAEVAMLGWRPGVEMWPGKEGMLAQSWMGVRRV